MTTSEPWFPFFPGFRAVYEQHREHDGRPFVVLGIIDPTTYDYAECGTMFRIRFTDTAAGEATAWPEELLPVLGTDRDFIKVTP